MGRYVGIRFGRHHVVPDKSVEGSLAFFGCSFFSVVLIFLPLHPEYPGYIIFLGLCMALLTSTFEMVPLKIDDNLTIPLFTAFSLWILCGLLDIPLNPANMIVLPLILGIGIDDGVHVVHDFRRQTGRYRLSRSTATAVLLTSATTMIGFGTMMFAQHQGLRSLGQVLTIGVFCCLGTSIVMLPALLAWMSHHQSDEREHEHQPAGHVDTIADFRPRHDPTDLQPQQLDEFEPSDWTGGPQQQPILVRPRDDPTISGL